MRNYRQRCQDNILPLSQAKTPPKAFSEWRFTEKVRDHEKPTETCELCGKDGLRYRFEIENHYTQHTLWVGSTCILQFDISVFEGGVLLDRRRAERKLNTLKKNAQHAVCVRTLKQVAKKANDTLLFKVLDDYQDSRCLTPLQAFSVFLELEDHGIEHNRESFKVRAGKRGVLRTMRPYMLKVIWPALSPDQRRRASKSPHSSPNGNGQ